MSHRPDHPEHTDGAKAAARVANYTVAEAAAWLRVPVSTTRAWAIGRAPAAKPVIDVADPERGLLSFANLCELHVLASIRRQHGVTLQTVRKACVFLRREIGRKDPLLSPDMLTDGKDLFVEKLGTLVNVSRAGQTEMKSILEAYLKRIERDRGGEPVRLYPFSNATTSTGPRSIVIDPRIQFGKPCIAGAWVPTRIIAERFRASETIASIAYDYGIPEQKIEDALRYEMAA
ncbi:MAG: DUF433 domain-containing protein [Planctomycetes bacterium]|nr:DUF433 domain-containing protein [Planctomycetota bacterium]